MYELGLDIQEADLCNILTGPEWAFDTWIDHFPERTGSMVTLELRLFFAKWPSMSGNHVEALNRLFVVLFSLKENFEKNKKDILTTYLDIASLFVTSKDLRSALKILDSALEISSDEFKPTLISYIGRINVLIGNIGQAKIQFETVQQLLTSKSASDEQQNGSSIPIDLLKHEQSFTLLFNNLLLAISEEMYEYAQSIANAFLSSNATKKHVNLNNYGVLCVYRGELNKAISSMESGMRDIPNMTSGSWNYVGNLCTMYDLKDKNTERKKRLGGALARYAGDSFPTDVLKMF
jgi:tetratricopeptide (TPR) repeat protein